MLLIGAVIWSYLGILFEILTQTVGWERWEGTIEYTFMAPLSRAVHLLGMGAFAVVYGLIRTVLLFFVVASFFTLDLGQADFWAAFVVLVIASVSFLGVGVMTAVFPLISPEKGTQLGFIAQGMLLVVSGVYYSVSILPDWMQVIAKISPATYALDGIRKALLDGAGVSDLWSDIWPLLVIGAVVDPARVRGLPPRRGLRQAQRPPEEVGMIRRAETDADLAAYAACWAAVWPEDPISVDFVRERVAREPERLYLLAEDGPRVVATGCVARSSRSGVRPVAVAVVPERRGKGLGGRLLDLCLAHARGAGGRERTGMGSRGRRAVGRLRAPARLRRHGPRRLARPRPRARSSGFGTARGDRDRGGRRCAARGGIRGVLRGRRRHSRYRDAGGARRSTSGRSSSRPAR